jgi:hypothetical protein
LSDITNKIKLRNQLCQDNLEIEIPQQDRINKLHMLGVYGL